MEAVDRASGEVFARIVSRDGSVGYYSHIIVHKDSPFAKVEDILKCDKSLDFGIGDPNSTSGFLVPNFYLFAQNKIDPRIAFKTMRNASHGANLQAVLARQADVATNNTEDVGKLEDVYGITPRGAVQLLDFSRQAEVGPELLRLGKRTPHQRLPGDASGKAQIVLDSSAGPGLSSEGERFEHQDRQALGRRIDRGRKPGGTCADDGYIVRFGAETRRHQAQGSPLRMGNAESQR